MAESDQPGFFSFRGTLGRGYYCLGLLVECVVIFFGMIVMAGASHPTQGWGSAGLVLVPIALLYWIHTLITVKRVRDTGLATWAYVVFVGGPFLAIAGIFSTFAIDSTFWKSSTAHDLVVIFMFFIFAIWLIPAALPPKSDE